MRVLWHHGDIDLLKWVNKYEEQWEDKPIEYKNEFGDWKADSDPLFGSISTAIQSRAGYQLTSCGKSVSGNSEEGEMILI